MILQSVEDRNAPRRAKEVGRVVQPIRSACSDVIVKCVPGG